jgi:hypothetical protein
VNALTLKCDSQFGADTVSAALICKEPQRHLNLLSAGLVTLRQSVRV